MKIWSNLVISLMISSSHDDLNFIFSLQFSSHHRTVKMNITKENFENFNLENRSCLKLASVDFEDKCDPFRVDDKDFQMQYFPYYNARVDRMSKMVEMRAKHRWGDDTKFFELNKINDTEEDQRICLIGIIFKYLEKHPSILKEVSEEYQVRNALD